jgi:cysteine desulfurase / selenocysteine lyase
MAATWWEALRARLPICGERAYFFPGAHGPLSIDARAAMLGVIDEWDRHAFHVHERAEHVVEDCARGVAALAGCDASRIVFATNTSDALNIGAASVLAVWRRAGSPPANVVLHDQSHAASTYAWLNAVRLGEAIEIRIAQREPGETAVDALVRRVDGETLAVVTTHVSNWDGERLDLVELAGRFPDRSFALIADAAQSAGALPLDDVVRVCDFVGMPAYKFMLGAAGVGFLVVGERWLRDPGPTAPGWAGCVHPLPILPFSLELAPTAAAFRLGIPNYVGLAATSAGIGLLVEAGIDRVGERIHELTGLIIARLDGIGLDVTTPRSPAQRAGVLTVIHPDAPGAMARLAAAGIDVGVERTEIRVDVHAYNDESDVDRLIAVLTS